MIITYNIPQVVAGAETAKMMTDRVVSDAMSHGMHRIGIDYPGLSQKRALFFS